MTRRDTLLLSVDRPGLPITRKERKVKENQGLVQEIIIYHDDVQRLILTIASKESELKTLKSELDMLNDLIEYLTKRVSA